MPAGGAVLAMDWRDTLFLHWPLDPGALRSRIPPSLTVDTYGGSAWIGIVAFRIAAARPRGLPHALGWPSFGEINVRTYVRDGATAGVWFFSLDAASGPAVAVGRAIHLPYERARIATSWNAANATYASRRAHGAAPFAATATFAPEAEPAPPGSLAQWLVERYAFFTTGRRGRLLRGDVAHPPWALRHDAVAQVGELGLLGVHGFAGLGRAAPLVHASDGVAVRAWPLRRAGG